jgi:hypothetical protein
MPFVIGEVLHIDGIRRDYESHFNNGGHYEQHQ